MKIEQINDLTLSEKDIAEVYELHLNPKLDTVASVEINEDGSIEIYYYYDGEPATQNFTSLLDFQTQLEKYGRYFEI